MIETDERGYPVEVLDLDASTLLAVLADKEAQERQAGRGKLRLAHRWCVLHPATEDSGPAVWGDAGLPGTFGYDEVLGGEGTPLVAAFAPEPFAAALGVSTMSGMQLLADALDLVHRLPLAWAKVQALEVAPWQARKLAQATHKLSRAAATYVDQALADRLGSCGWRTIESAINYAEAKFHPELLAEREKVGKRAWDVTVDHHHGLDWAGTSTLHAVGDTLDLTKFYDLVCDEAAALAALGDTDDLGQRKAKALGVIADRQATLDLHSLGDDTSLPSSGRPPTTSKTRMYLHLSLSDLLAWRDGCSTGTVERLGPATIAKIREWVGHSRVTVVPVLDMARADSVDTHDPPAWMRELVILRDRHCVYPHCERDARGCDLDHIKPYDEHGPPGQTNPENLAPLCRRHHRAKTLSGWRYRRQPDGTYEWHGPHGRAWLVTPLGSFTLNTN